MSVLIRFFSRNPLSLVHLLLIILIVSIATSLVLITTAAAYNLMGEREIRLSSSEPGATNDYRVDFDVSTTGDLGGTVITFCADSPIINDTNCEAPDNMNLTQVLANLNLGDIDLSQYEALTSTHASSGSAEKNTATLIPKIQYDVENWDEVTNSSINLGDTGYDAMFAYDNQVLVLANADTNGVEFIDSSDPDPANWTEIVNNNISLSGYFLGGSLAFTADASVLVAGHGDSGFISFIDSSDPDPANWTEISNSNISLPGAGLDLAFTSDENILVAGGDGTTQFVTFIDSSDPDPANWTEVSNAHISLTGRFVNSVTFTSDDQSLVLTHESDDHVTLIDSSDPNPANWTEISNGNVSLENTGYAATFTSNDNVLVLAHRDGDNVTFVDSSDPNPANWTEISNGNVSLPGRGYATTFISNESVLVLGHQGGDNVTFVDSSDPNPANWTQITNTNISLDGVGRAATFTSDNQILVLAHAGGDNVTFVDSSAILGYEAPEAVASGESATFELRNARNPSTLGTFYARIYTYAEPEHALDYTLANPSAGGAVIDAGGIALSTANLLTIESKVQERLSFCIFTADLDVPGDYETCSHGSPTPIALGDENGVLSTVNPSISKEVKYNITTNAAQGATVRIKGTTLAAGSFTIDPTGDATPGDGIAQTSTPGTEQFGLCTYTDPSSPNTDLSAIAPYNDVNCPSTQAGQDTGFDSGASFAFSQSDFTSTYGDSIASKPAGDWSTGRLVFLGNIANTTEPGIYTTTMDVVTTGRY